MATALLGYATIGKLYFWIIASCDRICICQLFGNWRGCCDWRSGRDCQRGGWFPSFLVAKIPSDLIYFFIEGNAKSGRLSKANAWQRGDRYSLLPVCEDVQVGNPHEHVPAGSLRVFLNTGVPFGPEISPKKGLPFIEIYNLPSGP